MLFKDYHKKFLEYLEIMKNKSAYTIEQYDRHLNKFCDFLEDENIDSYAFKIEDISIDLLDNFRRYLLYNDKDKKISVKTQNAYMITIRSFLRYVEKK
jgi:site-specific recombinase XerD